MSKLNDTRPPDAEPSNEPQGSLPLKNSSKGRIQLVNLAAYGAPAGCIGYHYPDLFFGTAAPPNNPAHPRE